MRDQRQRKTKKPRKRRPAQCNDGVRYTKKHLQQAGGIKVRYKQ
jgi:hypothetical protein